jgi:uncharacterized protein YjiK
MKDPVATALIRFLLPRATGLLLALPFFAAVGAHAQLLITEIQSSQAASGVNDYWELTNVGTNTVDLSGWKWDDDSRNPAAADAVTIPGGTTIAPGESLIFTALSPAAFSNWWGLTGAVKIVSTGAAPGLGQNDAVALFNGTNEVAFLSYAAGGFTRSSGSPAAGGHAGASGGGTTTSALVLDPTFGTTPGSLRYSAATVGNFGAFASAANAGDIGSPGTAALGGGPLVTLSLFITPTNFLESATNPAAVGTISRTGSTNASLVVTLASSDVTEVTVPASVTIPAGQTSAVFNVTAVDDSFPDGNQTVTITASAPGATAASFSLTVQDDGDVLTLKLMVTEIQSQQSAGAPGGAADYWELSNFGTLPVDLTGFTWHDSGRSYTAASNYALPAGSVILPGESVIFTVASPATFRLWWNLPSSVKVFQTVGAPGLGQNDGISFFDNGGNELFFLSYAASGFAREDGSPSSGGHAGPSAGATNDSVALIWVPSSGTIAPRYTFATGTNHGSFKAAGAATDLGSPGTTVAGPKSLNLSQYVRVGRYNLPEPTRTTPPNSTNLLCQEASGVAYNWDTDTLFIVGDGGRSVTQVSKTGALINSMTMALGGSPQGTDFYDPEGITYIGNGQFVFTEERDRQLVKFTYNPAVVLARTNAQTVKLGTFVPNIGLEGLSFDPLTGGFICVKEISPLGVFQTLVDFDAGTASNGSPTTENSTNLFDPALLGVTDLADVYALANLPSFAGQPQFGNLLLLSHESAKVLEVDRAGNILSSLNLVTDPGNPLSIVDQQHEGLTMDREGNLYLVSENGGGSIDYPQLWVFAPSSAPNAAPTAIALSNAVLTLAENSSTATPIKLADIFVTDDGLGTNVLSVTGADAAFFEITGFALFLKAGTVLDYETKSSYGITVQVDDVSVGGTPDASVAYTLTVTDIVDETPAAASLVITEVAPWASGNSPVAADWFEVSNLGSNTVNISGWRVDDSSAAFATSAALNGITNIAPGESVIFIETASLAAARAAFPANWFGPNAPTNLQIGSYSGAGLGLSTGGDGVTLFDSNQTIRASVTFGASPAAAPFATFDNSAGLDNTTISRLSVPRVYGAFHAANNFNEIGSPGTRGSLIISEVAPWASGSSPVGADWFEVINTTPNPIDLTGWKVDDNSASFAAAAPLTGVTNIAPGEAVIFLETANLAATRALFLSNWFGAFPPASLQVGAYSGAGLGLSTGGDGVTLFDATGTLRAKVTFGASPAGPQFPTFDNTVGLNDAVLVQLSAVNVRGGFIAANSSNEVGSPGVGGKLIISEVAPWASGSSPVAADWFELSNVGATPLLLAGWKMDDNSQSPVGAVPMSGISQIAPGESVIFIESTNLALARAAFLSNWFGTTNLAAPQIGVYSGSGVGLGTGGDAVNIYSSNNVLLASLAFGASPSGPVFPTFENAGGLNNATVSQLSSPGLNGAFLAVNSTNEIGSPGILTVPGLSLLAAGTNLVLQWPLDAAGYRVQDRAAFTLPEAWNNITNPVVISNSQHTVVIPLTTDARFFRLRK